MKKKKQKGEEVTINRRISQKDSMALLKLHRISKKLPAATLAAFGRCRAGQAPTFTLRIRDEDKASQV